MSENVIAPSPRMTVLDGGIEAGVQWCICQAPIYDAVNGYVKLPADHPWQEIDLQSVSVDGLDVHGGITFGPTHDGWIGFDTLHSGDRWPGKTHPIPTGWDHFWTQKEVIEETRSLARQVAASFKNEDDAE